MARRPAGTKYWQGGSETAVITNKAGQLYSLFLNWRALTAGDRILLVDIKTGDVEKVIEEIIISTADNNGFEVPMPAVGKSFEQLKFIAPADADELNVSVGYDGA